MESVVSEFEGTLLHDPNTFSYFMLVAFEASGLIRFAFLLMLWPIICLLNLFKLNTYGLKMMIFVATAGLRVSEIESVARAVLPKFFMDDIDLKAWGVFSNYDKRVVVTNMPRVMVESFVMEHLRANDVVGCELAMTRFGHATGFLKGSSGSISDRVRILFRDDKPSMALGSFGSFSNFLSPAKEQSNPPFTGTNANEHVRPLPVIFHDGRLVKLPTPFTALLILLWIPFGVFLAIIRLSIGFILPMWAIPYVTHVFGANVVVKGRPPPPSNSGVLFVCTHRTLMDPVVLSVVLQRSVPALTYSVSRLSEILSPIPTIRLTRIRHVDAEKITRQLSKGDLVVCPEGTTCREPFLLRFSGLFAELTDRIVPVAMNYRVGFFHATTARGWKCFDPVFFFMNPRPVYEVTFLNQLPHEATCSSGKSPHDVANYVQRILAATLGFECTNLTRKDKYRILAGNDGTVSYATSSSWVMKLVNGLRKVTDAFKPFYSLKWENEIAMQ